MIDAGWGTEAIYGWCLEAGQQKGSGRWASQSAGCTSAAFDEPPTERDKMGQRRFLPRGPAVSGGLHRFGPLESLGTWPLARTRRNPRALFLFGHRDENTPTA